MADTVWTTVKVRRSLLGEAAESRPGTSNAQLVEQALRQTLEQGPESTGSSASPTRGGLAAPARAPVAQRIDLLAPSEPPRVDIGHRRQVIEGQTTVDEMLASCPNCAGELHRVDVAKGGLVVTEGAQGCLDCGYVREGT